MPVLDHNDNHIRKESLALHYAALRGCIDCVRILLNSIENNFNANTQMDNDVTPVYLAAQEGHLDVLVFLVVEAGGSLYVRAADGMTPLHAASQMGYLNCVKWIVEDQKFNPNVRDFDGATPLHFAASRGHLDIVQWLLKHGARLLFDKFGKSPINDAAENKQVECLNLLVQYGTTPDYSEQELYFNKSDISSNCSCNRRQSSASDKELNYRNESPISRKSSENSFYLHPPSSKSTHSPVLQLSHTPLDGVYINPMTIHRNSSFSSSCDSSNETIHTRSSFYLHNPKNVIYDRVKNLFFDQQPSQPSSEKLSSNSNSITVKVEVNSLASSSVTESDENSSISESLPTKQDHEYEDIYLLKNQDLNNHKSVRKSLSENSKPLTTKSELDIEFLSTNNKSNMYDTKNLLNDNMIKSEQIKNIDEKRRVQVVTSIQTMPNSSRGLKRSASVQNELLIGPPPPPPPMPVNNNDEIVANTMPTRIHGKRMNSSCSDLTSIELTYNEINDDKHVPNLVNKKRVLPFIPPSFPEDANQNGLIKPSEYLKSLNSKSKLLITMESNINYNTNDKIDGDYKQCDNNNNINNNECNIPKPPPIPSLHSNRNDAQNCQYDSKIISEEEQKSIKKQLQPLSTISIQDLNSVHLRKVEKPAAIKTYSVPVRSVSMQSLQTDPVDTNVKQKQDLINELKLAGGDVTGLRKMKIEKAQFEEKREKQYYLEFSKQFTAENYMNNVPDKDQNGISIPDWKRQMLAKKAAERAKKEFAENLQREAEQKRLKSVPEWKKQLLAKKEEAEQKMRSIIYTPKVVDDVKIVTNYCTADSNQKIEHGSNQIDDNEAKNPEEILNNNDGNKENEDIHIIPWRSHLRKTNSSLNLLA